MRIAYFTEDLDFANRYAKLLGKRDADMIFELTDCRSKGNCIDTEKHFEKFKVESDVRNFDLIISDVSGETVLNEVDVIIAKEDKLLTLDEHYNKLIDAYRKKHGIKNSEVDIGDAKILYFCSSSGGSGKTTVARGLASEFCRFHDKKVLYICMEPFGGNEVYVEGSDRKRNLDELLYCLFTKKQVNVFDFLVSNQYGVFEFCPSQGKNPLYELEEGEMETFLRTVEAQGEFDYIVCDGYLPLGRLEIMLMVAARRICIVDDGKNDFKLKNMLLYFERGIYVQKDKIVKIKNLVPMGYECEEGTVCIERDENCTKVLADGRVEINTDVDFGRGIKHLCEKIK